MDIRNRAVCILLLASCLAVPTILRAQWIKGLASVRKLPALERSLVGTIAKRPDIRLSVARLDHALLLNAPPQQRPHSTAFLFQTTYQGHPQVWAATAGHVAHPGEAIRLTFYNGKKEIPVDGTVAQTGPALLSDAALIRLEEPLPPELQPFPLAPAMDPSEPLTTWGYASNKLYHLGNLTFEKDNTRFIRTDFPATQKKRAGLCGGPLLNPKGEVLGIHCGTSLQNKAYAANIHIIPYLLQAYYEGTAEIPLIMKTFFLGNIDIHERIVLIQCTDEYRHPLNQLEVDGQLHQSDVLALLQNPKVRFVKFILARYIDDNPSYRILVYDKPTRTHTFEPFQPRRWYYE